MERAVKSGQRACHMISASSLWKGNTACCPVAMLVDSVRPSPLIGNVLMSTSWSLVQDVGVELLQDEILHA